MPINSLTQRTATPDPVAGIRMLGIIHKGDERTQALIDAKKPGPDLEYFRITYTDSTSWLEGHVKRIYGDKPTFFDPVFLFGDTAESSFPNWREERGLNGKRVVRRCDEVHQQMWVDDRDRLHNTLWGEAPLACRGGGEHGGCAICKYNGKLRLLLVQLYQETKAFGYFLLNTSSQNDIISIAGSIASADELGKLDVIAFKLGREKRHAGWRAYDKKDGSGTGVTQSVKSLIYLEPSALAAARINKLISANLTGTQAMLTEGADKKAIPAVAVSAAEDEDVEDGEFTEADESIVTPTQVPPPPKVEPPAHWASIKENRDQVLQKFASYGITTKDGIRDAMIKAEPGVEKLSESKTLVPAEYIALIDKAFSKPAAAPEKVVVTDLKDVGAAISNEPPFWTTESRLAFDKKIMDIFPDVMIADIHEALGSKEWALPAEREAELVYDLAADEMWRVVTDKIGYFKSAQGNQEYVLFSTVVGNIRFYSTTKLKEQVGEPFFRANRMERLKSLENGIFDTIEPVILTWKRQTRDDDGTVYFTATEVQPVGDLDSKLAL